MLKPLLTGQWLRTVGLTVTLLLALLPARAQDIGTTFDVGNLTYRVLTENTVEVAGPAEGSMPSDVTIPAKFNNNGTVFDVVAIGENAFWNQPFVTVSLPSSVKTLKAYSFYNCWQMTSIDMSAVESIESAALAACWALKSVTLPETLSSLASNAFYDSKFNNGNSISYIYFLGGFAPEITDGYKLSFLQEDIKVYVPTGCESAYQAIIATSADNIKTFPKGDTGATSLSLNQDPTLNLVFDEDNRTINFEAQVESVSTYAGNYDWTSTGSVWVDQDKSNPANATVHINNPGEASVTVTVTDTNGKPISATCKINIYGIEMRNSTFLKPGTTYKYTTYRIHPESQAENITLNWSTTDNKIATVDQQGNITALSEGRCYLQAQATINGISTTSQNEIIVVSEINSDPESLVLKVGESSELLLKIPFMENNRYGGDSWTSSDENIVSVNGNRAIGISNGTATLTGTMNMSDGETITATCPVVVGNLSQNEIFEVDNIRYKVIGINTVEVAGPVDKTTLINAEIPTEVTYNGINLKVTSIGNFAFEGCNNLTAITLADGITSIGWAAFRNCENLTILKIAPTIKSVDKEAFYGCRSLASITFPEGISNIASGAFANTSLTNVTFPESLVKLGETAFSNTKYVYFKGEVPPTIIDWNGNEAQSLILDYNDAIIYVPNEASVETYKAIAGNHTVKAIVVPDNGATKVAFSENEITLISGSDETKNITLNIEPTDYDGEIEWNISPEWLADMTVADDKMSATLTPNRSNCGVATVTATVTSTDGSKLTASCKVNVFGLRINNSIVLKPETEWKAECEIAPESMADGISLLWATDNPNVATVEQDGTITTLAIGECHLIVTAVDENGETITTKENSIVVLSEVKSSPESLLMKPGDEMEVSIKLGNSWHSFPAWQSDDENVAYYDTETRKIHAAAKGNAILSANCTLSNGDTLPVTCKVTVGNVAAGDTFEIDGIKYSVLTENTVEVAGPADGFEPTEVTIPSEVTLESENMTFKVASIGYDAFNGCYNLTSVELPEGLVSIDFQAFLGCSKLSSINFPEGLTSIEFGAFSGCNTLVSVVFPSSLQSIGGNFLRWCNNLNLIYFLGTIPPQITGDNDLYGLNQNVKIYVPAESAEVYKSWTEAYKDNIVGIERPANGATEVTLNHTSLLLPGREWKDVTFNATVTTQSGNKYDGDYLWDVSPNWSTTITTTEEAPNEVSINLFNNQVHTVTVTVYSPEGTPLTASCNIIPLDISMLNNVTMLKGEEYDLNASITPDNYSDLSEYTDLSIRFTSGNPKLAEVSEDGVITALEYGPVNILAEIVDADGNIITRKTCVVNICSGIRPQYTDITIPVRRGMYNRALLEPVGTSYFTLCESNDPQMVYVSPDGWISANSVGETDMTLTYTTTTGHTLPSFTCHVKVVDEITGIRISAPNGAKTMTVGSKLQLKAVSEPDGDPVPVVWRYDNNDVASVNYYTGEVIARNLGTCTITAYAAFDENIMATYEITVTEVDGITIDKSTVILNAGNSTQLNATVEPADAEVEIEWTSSNEDVASVDPLTGEVTANNTGVATITATVKGTDVSASCTVIVSNPTGIDDVDTDGVSVKGINGQIIVTGAPADAAVEIYSIAGSRIAVEKGNCAVSVNAGIYVVRVAGTTVKVAVK